MNYPRTTRNNMRYRGPVETHKMNRNVLETWGDLSSLHKQMNNLSEKLAAYKGAVYEGTEAIEGLGVYASRLDRATSRIKDIERGVKRG